MKTLEQLGISPAPWSIDYDYDDGVPYRVNCTRPLGLSNRVFDDCDGILDADALLIAAAPDMYKRGFELVSALDDWMKKYPPSEFSTFGQAYQLLVEATNNFRAALAKAAGESEVKV